MLITFYAGSILIRVLNIHLNIWASHALFIKKRDCSVSKNHSTLIYFRRWLNRFHVFSSNHRSAFIYQIQQYVLIKNDEKSGTVWQAYYGMKRENVFSDSDSFTTSTCQISMASLTTYLIVMKLKYLLSRPFPEINISIDCWFINKG